MGGWERGEAVGGRAEEVLTTTTTTFHSTRVQLSRATSTPSLRFLLCIHVRPVALLTQRARRALHTAPHTLFPCTRTASATTTTTTFHSPALCDTLTVYPQRTTPNPPRARPAVPCWRACCA